MLLLWYRRPTLCTLSTRPVQHTMRRKLLQLRRRLPPITTSSCWVARSCAACNKGGLQLDQCVMAAAQARLAPHLCLFFFRLNLQSYFAMTPGTRGQAWP